VDGVVRSVSNRDQVVRVDETGVSGFELLESDGIDVMNIDPIMDLITLDPKIATFISDDDPVPSLAPLS
jgi:hypothetical protein